MRKITMGCMVALMVAVSVSGTSNTFTPQLSAENSTWDVLETISIANNNDALVGLTACLSMSSSALWFAVNTDIVFAETNTSLRKYFEPTMAIFAAVFLYTGITSLLTESPYKRISREYKAICMTNQSLSKEDFAYNKICELAQMEMSIKPIACVTGGLTGLVALGLTAGINAQGQYHEPVKLYLSLGSGVLMTAAGIIWPLIYKGPYEQLLDAYRAGHTNKNPVSFDFNILPGVDSFGLSFKMEY